MTEYLGGSTAAYLTNVASMSETADIQAAFIAYHFGGDTVYTQANVADAPANSMVGHLYALQQGKQDKATGAITTVISSNLDNNVVVVTNGSGKISNSAVTTTRLGYISNATGVTGTDSSNLVFSSGPTFTGTVNFNDNVVLGATSADVVTINANVSANSKTVIPEQIGYLANATGVTGSNSNLVFSSEPTIFSPVVTSGIITTSTSFDIINTNATSVNIAGAATSINIGASTGTTYFKHNASVTGNITATANIVGGNVVSQGVVSATGTITSAASSANTAINLIGQASSAIKGGIYYANTTAGFDVTNSSIGETRKIIISANEPDKTKLVSGDIWIDY